ncbi:hypothetical protein M3J09_008037 [Ascochyta lentis]
MRTQSNRHAVCSYPRHHWLALAPRHEPPTLYNIQVQVRRETQRLQIEIAYEKSASLEINHGPLRSSPFSLHQPLSLPAHGRTAGPCILLPSTHATAMDTPLSIGRSSFKPP